MTNYVPGSMLEIILGHGAKSLPLNPELRELGGFAVRDACESVQRQREEAICEYMRVGAELAKEILER
jgi:hypothetical protein